eukprot:jgi/Psemu1/228151/e_gw1.2260.8.1
MAVAGEEVWGLNAYNQLIPLNLVLEKALESDERRQNGEPLSIFDGIPVSIKANIAEKSLPLTAGSAILGFRPGRIADDTNNLSPPPCGYDADTTRILLREKGGICIGTTSMDEFGMGSLGTNIPQGTSGGRLRYIKNPLPFLQHLRLFENDGEEHATSVGEGRTGSSASVAHGSCLLSLGTDTGGSVRLPASWCGLVGLKPSYGLLSRHGVVSYASSFDTVGVLANSVDCAASALDILAQRNVDFSRDSTFSAYGDCRNDPKHQPLSGIRVGIPCSFSVKECPEEIRRCWSRAADILHDNGAEIIEISTEDITPGLVQRALSAYYVLVSAEASSNLSRYDGFRYGVAASDEEVEAKSDDNGHPSNSGNDDMTSLERQYSASRRQGFGTEVSKRILCGASVLSSDKFHTYYEAAAKLRAALADEMSSVLDEKADVLLIPTVLSLPPKIGLDSGDEVSLTIDKINNTAMFANDIMTVPASLAGLPAVSIPVPIDGEETFMGGIQLISSRLGESVLLKSARALQ